MEHDALRNASVADSVPESLQGEEPVQPGANPVSNDSPGKEVQNNAEITEPLANPNIGKVADPDQIGSRLIEFLGEQILESLRIIGLFGRSGGPVSYTHLDVYKRQRPDCAIVGGVVEMLKF